MDFRNAPKVKGDTRPVRVRHGPPTEGVDDREVGPQLLQPPTLRP